MRSVEHLAFRSVLTSGELATHSRLYAGRDPDQTGAALTELIGDYGQRDGAHLYCCGPARLLDAARGRALALGWPATALHCTALHCTALHEERFTAAALGGGDTTVLMRTVK